MGAPVGTNITLECEIEASPKSINYWTKLDETGNTLNYGSEFLISIEIVSKNESVCSLPSVSLMILCSFLFLIMRMNDCVAVDIKILVN